MLTGETTKEESKNISINYSENKTKLIIKKNDANGNSLSQVKFNLLNSNKEIVYENIETNKDGVIEINNLVPGVYYLQETKAIDGYELNEELIEININLDEEKEVVVENKKIPEEPEKPKEPEEPEKPKNPEMPKLPRTGW